MPMSSETVTTFYVQCDVCARQHPGRSLDPDWIVVQARRAGWHIDPAGMFPEIDRGARCPTHLPEYDDNDDDLKNAQSRHEIDIDGQVN